MGQTPVVEYFYAIDGEKCGFDKFYNIHTFQFMVVLQKM
jgi:hypothetical protein